MATKEQRAEAKKIINDLGDNMPSSLRSPLRAVRDGAELPGTAESVLEFARELLRGDREL